MGTTSAEVGEKSVRYGGKEYATLDFTPPRAATVGTQRDNFLAVPEGWVLAEEAEGVVEEVVAKFPWGTHVLLFGNGAAYGTTLYTTGRFRGKIYLMQDGNGIKPSDKHARVLICAKVCAEPATDGEYCERAMTCLWDTGDFADCEVTCNGDVFQCHRAVLAQASPVFKQMLSGEMVEAKAQRIQLEALETETEAASAFLAFMYTGMLDCKSEHFPTVVKLADFYQLNCITAKMCNDMLLALDAGNVVPMTRLFKSMREKPHIGLYWTKLAERVQQSKELTMAMMSDV